MFVVSEDGELTLVVTAPVPELVEASPEPVEPAIAAAGVRGEGVLDGWPQKIPAVQLAGCQVNLARAHRPVGLREDTGDCLEDGAPSRPRGLRSGPKWRVKCLPEQSLAKVVEAD